jgi:hypothetical protein
MPAAFLGATLAALIFAIVFGRFAVALSRALKAPLTIAYAIGAAGALLPSLLTGLWGSDIVGYFGALCYLAWEFKRDSTKAAEARHAKWQHSDWKNPYTPSRSRLEIESEQLASFLSKAWRGEARLWRVWWGLGVPLSIALGALTGLLHVIYNSAAWHALAEESPFTVISISILSYAMMVAGTIAWSNMAWGCSKNVRNPMCTFAARGVIVLGLSALAISLLPV